MPFGGKALHLPEGIARHVHHLAQRHVHHAGKADMPAQQHQEAEGRHPGECPDRLGERGGPIAAVDCSRINHGGERVDQPADIDRQQHVRHGHDDHADRDHDHQRLLVAPMIEAEAEHVAEGRGALAELVEKIHRNIGATSGGSRSNAKTTGQNDSAKTRQMAGGSRLPVSVRGLVERAAASQPVRRLT